MHSVFCRLLNLEHSSAFPPVLWPWHFFSKQASFCGPTSIWVCQMVGRVGLGDEFLSRTPEVAHVPWVHRVRERGS